MADGIVEAMDLMAVTCMGMLSAIVMIHTEVLAEDVVAAAAFSLFSACLLVGLYYERKEQMPEVKK